MERLFTERQWRAIDWVESASYAHPGHEDYPSKPLLGPCFAGGEFRLQWRQGFIDRRAIGPALPNYCVYEARSGLLFSYLCRDKAEAIAGAREQIADMGSDHLAWLIESEAEFRAQREARAAIDRAKQQPKPRKVSKRSKAVFEASDGKCHYCGMALTLDGRWHIEHKMPRALKGGSEMHNLAAACVPCNLRKKDRTDLEFQALLAKDRAETA